MGNEDKLRREAHIKVYMALMKEEIKLKQIDA
jgi:hypothetical protein